VELMAEQLRLELADDDNLAQAGATTGWLNINEPLRGALQLSDTAPIRGVQAQVEAVLTATPALDADRLYLLWAGGHDFGAYLESGYPDLLAHPPADNIRAAAQRLADAGARRFLIGLMPSLADTPSYRGTAQEQAARELVDTYNAELRDVAADLRAAGARVILLDAAPAFLAVATNPAAHGVTEIIAPYLPPDFIDFANPLAAARPLPDDRIGRSPEEFLTFWAVSAGPAVHRQIGLMATFAVTETFGDQQS
jgi:phospholipase/lecithinase/hemolysin